MPMTMSFVVGEATSPRCVCFGCSGPSDSRIGEVLGQVVDSSEDDGVVGFDRRGDPSRRPKVCLGAGAVLRVAASTLASVDHLNPEHRPQVGAPTAEHVGAIGALDEGISKQDSCRAQCGRGGDGVAGDVLEPSASREVRFDPDPVCARVREGDREPVESSCRLAKSESLAPGHDRCRQVHTAAPAPRRMSLVGPTGGEDP
jgi:hypothetical protein